MITILDSMLHLQDVPADKLKQITAELTIKNPEYEKRRRIGLNRWAWGQEYIRLWKEEAGAITLPRGYYARLWELIDGQMDIHDNRVKLQYIEFPQMLSLRDYQEPVLELAQTWEQGVVISGCGSGKTEMGMGIAADLGQPTLWIAHTLDLVKQSMDRAIARLGLSGRQIGVIQGENLSIGTHMTFATVQTLARRDLADIRNRFGCIIVDECFVAGTLINGMQIEKLKAGDQVQSYNHESQKVEPGTVIALSKRKPEGLLKIILSNGTPLICTNNHPFWIEEKNSYVPANKIMEGQHVRDYSMHFVQKTDYSKTHLSSKTLSEENGKDLLLSGMREAGTGSERKNSRSNSKIQQGICRGTNEKEQSYEESGKQRENENFVESNGTQTSKETGKRNWNDKTAGINNASTEGTESYSGIRNSNEDSERERISNKLQSRCGIATVQNSDRTGWIQSSVLEEKGGRQSQRYAFDLVRVDSIEILEQTSDGTYGGMCPDGYVYNLEVEGCHNYFANGVLVHNCHLVVKDDKAFRMFADVIAQFPAFYRFGLTASEFRSDGLIETMFHLIGPKIYEVAQNDPRLKTVKPKVEFVETSFVYTQPIDEDGEKKMLSVQQMYKAMREDYDRELILKNIMLSKVKSTDCCLVLGDSLDHLQVLQEFVESWAGLPAAFVCGETPKREREKIMADVRAGRYQYLFATYALAKLGLDIPRLNKMVLLTPKRDKTSIQQAAGRLMRPFDGKGVPVIYDLWDVNVPQLRGWARERVKVYRTLGCEIINGPNVRK